MDESDSVMRLKARLAAKLAESVIAPLSAGTPRQVWGRVTLPGKATAVVGMRRAGKTTFLHQQRGERLKNGVARERLPYVNFEDEQLAGMEAKDLHQCRPYSSWGKKYWHDRWRR